MDTQTDDIAESVSSDSFSSSDIYDVLSDRRRRYAVHYLKQVDGPVGVRELAEQVAAWENDKSVEELDSQERKRVYISLYQSHLSTLDQRGVVDYDEDAGTVELLDGLAEADVYLEVVSHRDIPWSYFYLGLTAAAGLLLAMTWLEVGILRDISVFVVAGVIVLGYGVTAVVQTVQRGRMKLGDDGPPPELNDD
jgi:predicted transcriptional regulator